MQTVVYSCLMHVVTMDRSPVWSLFSCSTFLPLPELHGVPKVELISKTNSTIAKNATQFFAHLKYFQRVGNHML